MDEQQNRLTKQQLDEKISRELMAGMDGDLSNVSQEAEDVLASLGGDLFSDDAGSILTSIGVPQAQDIPENERETLLEESLILFPKEEPLMPIADAEADEQEITQEDLPDAEVYEEASASQDDFTDEIFEDTVDETDEAAATASLTQQVRAITMPQRIFLGALALLFVLSVGSICTRFAREVKLLSRDVIFGVEMEGVSLEGMTFTAAADAISDIRAQKDTSQVITLQANGKAYTTTLDEFSPEYDVDGALDLAHAVGRTGTRRERLFDIYASRGVAQMLAIPCSFDETAVRSYVDDLAEQVDQPMQNASIEFDPQMTDVEYPFIQVQEQVGQTLDRDSAIEAIRDCAVTGARNVTLDVTITEPTVFLSDLKENVQPMRTFTTEYSRIANRTFNIHRATDTINGTMIQPGEEFSFNRIVGNTSLAENGYREAGVIVGGRSATDRGGGVCQAATTIYNVAVRCDMEITARDPHAIASSYVPRGQDATIAYGHCDLAFINTSEYPIYIVGTYTDTTVTFTFFGRPLENGVTIEMESEHLGTRSPGAPKITVDPTKPTTYEETVVSALNGYDVRVYKVWYDSEGNEINRVIDHVDAYPTRRAEIIVGGMEVAAPDPIPDAGDITPPID